MRKHFEKVHPDGDKLLMERHIFNTRYPEFDLDAAIAQYLRKEATVWTFKKQGYRITRILRLMNALRSYGEDITLQRKFKHGSVSVHDNPNYLASLKANHGVDNPLKSEVIKDKKLMTELKKDGLEELFEPAKVLREMKKLRRAMNKAEREAKEKVSET